MEEYYKQEWQRIAGNYSKSKHKGFANKEDLANWFVSQLKKYECRCFYCETSIHDINRLIDAKLLVERKTGYGWRGRILEVDKNEGNYLKDHCVLSCMYCNNDKSYTTSKEHYKKYFGLNRKKYFELLLSELETSKL